MAIVSTEKVYLKTGVQFQKIVKYSKKKFSCDLPTELCKDLLYVDDKDKVIFGATEDEVNKKFKDKLNEWEESQTNEVKVILFDAEFQGALAKKSFEYRWKNGYTPSFPTANISSSPDLWEFHCDDLHRDSGLGMLIRWAVYSKNEFKDKKSYKYISGRYFNRYNLERGDVHGLTEIEWTEEREQFFLQLDESFANMIAKVYKALGDLTPEKLILLTESGLKLLSNQNP